MGHFNWFSITDPLTNHTCRPCIQTQVCTQTGEQGFDLGFDFGRATGNYSSELLSHRRAQLLNFPFFCWMELLWMATQVCWAVEVIPITCPSAYILSTFNEFCGKRTNEQANKSKPALFHETSGLYMQAPPVHSHQRGQKQICFPSWNLAAMDTVYLYSYVSISYSSLVPASYLNSQGRTVKVVKAVATILFTQYSHFNKPMVNTLFTAW